MATIRFVVATLATLTLLKGAKPTPILTPISTLNSTPISNVSIDPFEYKHKHPANVAGTYDCDGGHSCPSMHVKYCDWAINYLYRTNETLYGSHEARTPYKGTCQRAFIPPQGCSIIIEGGPDCMTTGNVLWQQYQDIRKKGRCEKCGHYYWEWSDCKTTITNLGYCDV